MLQTLLISFLICHLSEARVFNNPILGSGDYPDPGAIKVNGVYYIVTTANRPDSNKFPINISTDLVNWEEIGYIFNANNFPPWSNEQQAFWAPEIHRIGSRFHVYYTARHAATGRLAIGVAVADSVTGPYSSPNEPFFLDPVSDVLDPTIINDNGTLYFIWKTMSGIDWIFGRPLNPDGITFPSGEITPLFRHEYPWEDGVVEGPWYVRRGQYHYLFYSGHGFCSELYRVGVARALNPLGPYIKRGDPILASNDKFQGPGHNSIVKDLNDIDDIMVFHAFRVNEVCTPYPRVTLLASVGWDADDWPYVYDF